MQLTVWPNSVLDRFDYIYCAFLYEPYGWVFSLIQCTFSPQILNLQKILSILKITYSDKLQKPQFCTTSFELVSSNQFYYIDNFEYPRMTPLYNFYFCEIFHIETEIASSHHPYWYQRGSRAISKCLMICLKKSLTISRWVINQSKCNGRGHK